MSNKVPEYFLGYGVDKKENWDKPKLVKYTPKPLGAHDVTIKVECCGLCGSDLHTIQGGWGPLRRPDLVVGHEIIGEVVKVGTGVTSVKLGQRVGLGAKSDACLECARCKGGNEQYCKNSVSTYNKINTFANGYVTQGGYANYAIGNEQFVFPIPDNLPLEYAAPLMCAGLTTYSPISRALGKDLTGKTVGIIGIGGLGHLAIQFSKAMGATVIAFSRTSAKTEHALKMGASELIATLEHTDWTKKYDDKFDLILNCASGFSEVDISSYLAVLKVNGFFSTVGLPEVTEKFEISAFTMLRSGANIGQSLLGNREEALEMLNLAAEKNIRPWIEKIPISEKGCNEALKRCDKGDVRYRFVFTDFDKAFSQPSEHI